MTASQPGSHRIIVSLYRRYLVSSVLLAVLLWLSMDGVAYAEDAPDATRAIAERFVVSSVTMSAEAGDAPSQRDLGNLYWSGRFGVEQSYIEAVRWWRRAAEQGDASAQNNLGVAYARGVAVAQSDIEAVRWYRLAAEQGHVDSQRELGMAYWFGVGVVQDYAEAARWYRLAAEQGDATAQAGLGVYFMGVATEQDYVAAHAWLNVAAVRIAEAGALRDSLAEVMTREQIAEAQIMARDLWERIEAVAAEIRDHSEALAPAARRLQAVR